MTRKMPKPSMPTMPPMVLKGPNRSGVLSHHSTVSHPWTRPHNGMALMAAALATVTVQSA